MTDLSASAASLSLLLWLLSPAGCTKGAPSSTDDARDLVPSASASTVTLMTSLGSPIAACPDVPLCERECDAGQSDRCRRLGDSYQFANDEGKDDALATAYYERACALGNAPACLSAGQMYEFHHGVSKDDSRAAGYYKRGCDVGFVASCANLAIMLENGRGVPADIGAASALYERACRSGAGLACDRLRALGSDAGR